MFRKLHCWHSEGGCPFKYISIVLWSLLKKKKAEKSLKSFLFVWIQLEILFENVLIYLKNGSVTASLYYASFCCTTWIHPLSLELPSCPSSHRSRSPQSTELSSLCSQQPPTSSVLHMAVYIWQSYSQLFHPLLPPLCPQVHSLCLCLYSCPAERFVCTIFSRFCINALLLLLSHVSRVRLCATP